MTRKLAIVAVGAVLLGYLPVQAQEMPELEGGPGSHRVAKPAPAKPNTAPKAAQKPSQSAADKLKADEARLSQLVEAQKAEQTRLAQQAADLKAREARLDARATDLAAEEKRLTQRRAEEEAQFVVQQGELTRQREDAARQLALASERTEQTVERDASEVPADGANDRRLRSTPGARRSIRTGLDLDEARRSCTIAGQDAASARNFYSARYDSAPSFYEGQTYELRGLMRLEDRRGYLLVDTTCEVDADGAVQHFAFLR